jgi:hypothetical protein
MTYPLFAGATLIAYALVGAVWWLVEITLPVRVRDEVE